MKSSLRLWVLGSVRKINSNDRDQHHMGTALALARRGLGNVWPNPAVGCVIVDKRGGILSRGWTQPGGRPHAEAEALARLKGRSGQGATAYVTLEPCSHHGQTPPCAEALIAAGLARCVVATPDSDPRVSGRGIARMRAAGLAVEVGVREAEARALNAGFFLKVEQQRPLVTLKVATSLDGRIATASGESQWITGPQARADVHRLRAEHDAVAVGLGTVLADDPDLTCRTPGLSLRPEVRVVFDSRGRLPLERRMVQSATTVPVWRLGGGKITADGVENIDVPLEERGRVALPQALAALAARGITRLMVEGGGQLAAAFLKAGLVDHLVWYRAAKIIGGDGIPAIAALGLDRLAASPDFSRVAVGKCGADVVEHFERRG